MKTVFKHFEISSATTYDTEVNPWGEARKGAISRHFKHHVTVWNTETDTNTDFIFYGSQRDFEAGVNELPESDLLGAFHSLLSDGLSGLQDFEWFCSEMGYDTDSRKAYAIWEACKDLAEKLTHIDLEESAACDLLNELSELV